MSSILALIRFSRSSAASRSAAAAGVSSAALAGQKVIAIRPATKIERIMLGRIETSRCPFQASSLSGRTASLRLAASPEAPGAFRYSARPGANTCCESQTRGPSSPSLRCSFRNLYYILEVVTVLEVIQRSSEFLAKKGVESPRLQVELMLAAVLQLPRLKLYLNFDRRLDEDQLNRLRAIVKRRADREPLQHILGSTGFCR